MLQSFRSLLASKRRVDADLSFVELGRRLGGQVRCLEALAAYIAYMMREETGSGCRGRGRTVPSLRASGGAFVKACKPASANASSALLCHGHACCLPDQPLCFPWNGVRSGVGCRSAPEFRQAGDSNAIISSGLDLRVSDFRVTQIGLVGS